MSTNWNDNFLFNGSAANLPEVSRLTVWEADVEEAEADGTETIRRSIRFVSENDDLSPDVFEFASKAIDLKARSERLVKMALETVPISSTSVGSEPHRRIVGLRALFDAESLPFMQRSEDEGLKPGDRTFPADFHVDAEKWAKLAEGGTYRSTSRRAGEDRRAFTQGAFAELFKDAALRVLIDLCSEDKDRKLSDYTIHFFEGEQGVAADGKPITLEVAYCQSNSDPVAGCLLKIPMVETQNAMTEKFVAAHHQTGYGTIDEYTVQLVMSGNLPPEIIKAVSAVEEIVRDWAASPQSGLVNSTDPMRYFPATADK